MNQVCLRSFAVGVLLSVFMGSASAQTSTRSEEWNLEGTWKLSVGYFNFQQGGGCIVTIPTGGVGAVKDSPISISKSISGYSVRVNTSANIEVSGNRFVFLEKLGSNTLQWAGTISKKVDSTGKKEITTISGTETCNGGKASLPFTFVREDVAQNTITPDVPSIGVQLGQLATRQAEEEQASETQKYPEDCGKWLRDYVFKPFGIPIPPGSANTWAAWFTKHSETWQSVPNDGKFSTGDVIVITRPAKPHGHIMIVGTAGVVYDASLDDHGPQSRGDIRPGAPIKQSKGEQVTVWRLKE